MRGPSRTAYTCGRPSWIRSESCDDIPVGIALSPHPKSCFANCMISICKAGPSSLPGHVTDANGLCVQAFGVTHCRQFFLSALNVSGVWARRPLWISLS